METEIQNRNLMENEKFLRHGILQHLPMPLAEGLHLLGRERSANSAAGPHPAVPSFPGEWDFCIQRFKRRQMDAPFAPARGKILEPPVISVPIWVKLPHGFDRALDDRVFIRQPGHVNHGQVPSGL